MKFNFYKANYMMKGEIKKKNQLKKNIENKPSSKHKFTRLTYNLRHEIEITLQKKIKKKIMKLEVQQSNIE